MPVVIDHRASGDAASTKGEEIRAEPASPLIRYPGGKQKLLSSLLCYVVPAHTTCARFVEPFVGGGAVFFALNPKRALLTDLSKDLIDLYRGIRRSPSRVWRLYSAYEPTREAYYAARAADRSCLSLEQRAALTLYLNRTCFRGMWRVNKAGQFNVAYGGEDRRWAISQSDLKEVAKRLHAAQLKYGDFQTVINTCCPGDFIFADPPYSPGELEPRHDHYIYSQFTFRDHKRLASALRKATKRGVLWALTTSSHPSIVGLFEGSAVISLSKGTSRRPGIIEAEPGEVLICNYSPLEVR